MELHPILECGDNPSKGLWYVISSDKPPESRVGQACVARTNDVCGRDEILAIGGANPSATFSDIFRLDWTTLQWSQLESKGLRSRYEHSAFIPVTSPNLIYIFGGANKSGNLDCLQVYNTENNTWNMVSFDGHSPGPRTLHCGASAMDKLYVWGGGHLGADPVSDLQLHIFDAALKTWSQPDLQGDIPSARHGHAMVAVGNMLYIHGGMAGATFHDDLFAINLTDLRVTKITASGDIPCARAAHSVCAYQSQIYLFGGMCTVGALNDFFCFDTITKTWLAMKFDSPPPTPRLDHSMIFTFLPVKKEAVVSTEKRGVQEDSETPTVEAEINGTTENAPENGSTAPIIVPVDIWQGTVTGERNNMENLSLKDAGDNITVTEEANSPSSATVVQNGHERQEYTYVPVCVVIGGMDTSGNLFNDVLITTIGEKA